MQHKKAFAMIRIMIIYVFSVFSISSFGQYTRIISLSELPPKVLFKLNRYLDISFGNIKDGVKYVAGNNIDLKEYFKYDSEKYFYLDSNEYKNCRVRPKYDLIFLLNDSLLGISKYQIYMQLDEYGQLLSLRWPRSGFSKREKFIPIDQIKELAIKSAYNNGYNSNDFSYELEFKPWNEAMFWSFKFIYKKDTHGKDYYSGIYTDTYFYGIDIDIFDLKILREYKDIEQSCIMMTD